MIEANGTASEWGEDLRSMEVASTTVALDVTALHADHSEAANTSAGCGADTTSPIQQAVARREGSWDGCDRPVSMWGWITYRSQWLLVASPPRPRGARAPGDVRGAGRPPRSGGIRFFSPSTVHTSP